MKKSQIRPRMPKLDPGPGITVIRRMLSGIDALTKQGNRPLKNFWAAWGNAMRGARPGRAQFPADAQNDELQASCAGWREELEIRPGPRPPAMRMNRQDTQDGPG